MKHIVKKDIPDFFIEDTKDLAKWSDYIAKNKRKLKKYILENEQNNLCAYCEARVNFNDSHLEHIKPKSIYSDLTFNYNNLVISCNGKCEAQIRSPQSCGHKKDNEYDEDKFLNPVENVNIREYFKYKNYEIISADNETEKANYTIDILKLNPSDGSLQEARKKALENFRKNIYKINDNILTIKTNALKVLNDEKIAYISYLRYEFKNLL